MNKDFLIIIGIGAGIYFLNKNNSVNGIYGNNPYKIKVDKAIKEYKNKILFLKKWLKDDPNMDPDFKHTILKDINYLKNEIKDLKK